jgi:hypothetical protein
VQNFKSIVLTRKRESGGTGFQPVYLERIRSIHRPEACATFYFHEKREEGYFSKKLIGVFT